MSQSVDNLQSEYFTRMFRYLRPWTHLLPSEVQRTINIAESLHKYPGATAKELREEIGSNWVIARRSKRIVEWYGEDVKCLTHAEFVAAERRAVGRRFAEAHPELREIGGEK